MKILRTISRVPGRLMVVSLMLGAQFDTIDQMHVAPVQHVLKALGAAPNEGGHYEFLRVGGFVEALFKTGALTLIGLFLFCAASQIAGVAEASTAGNAAATPAPLPPRPCWPRRQGRCRPGRPTSGRKSRRRPPCKFRSPHSPRRFSARSP